LLLEEQPCDEESGKDEEERHPDLSGAGRFESVCDDDGKYGECTQPV
jgi:hypothetical protein